MDLIYTRNGDILFPALYLEDANLPIGKYGLLRKSYLKEHKRGWYSSLLLTGKLDAHLAEIDHSCNERIELTMTMFSPPTRGNTVRVSTLRRSRRSLISSQACWSSSRSVSSLSI